MIFHCDCPLDWSSSLSPSFQDEEGNFIDFSSVEHQRGWGLPRRWWGLLFSDRAMCEQFRHTATHLAQLAKKVRELYGTKYLTLISKNILIALIAVMFTLYYHELFKDTQKEPERRGNCPLVELPGGEPEYTLFLVKLTRTRGPSGPSGFRPVSLFFSDSTFLFHK